MTKRLTKFVFPLVRVFALVLPLVLFTTSFFFRWPDQPLEGRGIAIGTIQLATGSMLAWVLADSYIRMAQKRRLFRFFAETAAQDDSEVARTLHHILHHLQDTRPIVVVSTDDCIMSTRQAISKAVADEDLVAVFLGRSEAKNFFASTSVVEAARVFREVFVRLAEENSFKESEAIEIFRVASSRREIVAVVPVHTSDEALIVHEQRGEFHGAIKELNGKYRLIFVGSNRMAHSLSDFQPVVIDITASTRASGHAHQRIGPVMSQPGTGSRHLLSIIGTEVFSQTGILKKLRATDRMVPVDNSHDPVGAASALLSAGDFFTDEEKHELANSLQYSTQGLEVLAALPFSETSLWFPDELSMPSSGHLAVKRRFSLNPTGALANAVQLSQELSDSQMMDVIDGLRAHSPEASALLLALASEGRIAVRFAAATRLIKTLDSLHFPHLEAPQSLSFSVSSQSIDTDLAVGAWGWVVPSLVLTWPKEYNRQWMDTLHASSLRDPSHLGLSIARGILLSATDFPLGVHQLLSQFINHGPRFWLSDIKLIHAAGIACDAGAMVNCEIIERFEDSSHVLVQAVARTVASGLKRGEPPTCWTWGLESFETMAASWSQSDEVFRLLGQVAIEYGKFLRDLSDSNFSAVMAQATTSSGPSWNDDSFGLPPKRHHYYNAIKKAQIEFGPSFSLRQSSIAHTKEEKDFWNYCVASSLQLTGQNATYRK